MELFSRYCVYVGRIYFGSSLGEFLLNRFVAKWMALFIFLLGGNVALAADQPHWVDTELAAYKQEVLPYKDAAGVSAPITSEEWKVFYTEVLDSSKLDQPISTANWATGLKMAIDLPTGQKNAWIEGYVDGLADGKVMSRENAVGGMVKLLTGSYIKGSWSSTEMFSVSGLKDFTEISEKHIGLVQIAGALSLLDSTVTTSFRPKDKLTNAEAISMLHHVYALAYKAPKLPEGHWLDKELSQAYGAGTLTKPFLKVLNRVFKDQMNADQNISAENWQSMLLAGLPSYAGDKEASIPVTLGWSQDGGILRDRAVAGLVKLSGMSGEPTESARKKVALVFRDLQEAYDQGAIIQALYSGILEGREGDAFGVHGYLTNAEAAALIARASELALKNEKNAQITADQALLIGKSQDLSAQAAEAEWSVKWARVDGLLPLNQRDFIKPFIGWQVEAKYKPWGNRMIVYIDPDTGEIVVLSEIEPAGI